ncbi:unnamed protein product [Rotaria sp. Silwood2]|nr:unnamed protein product [Rotaria sp. Silwood2]CAF2813950.1 unnamed protein product [Rotaria sp. Silwood2]CAF3163987.1 unnamed protein product [Rotaria sp. Silwood2]CAF3249094.1 unnamed protein product [Rotaria sp. Silwood2]CAF3945912.1 unnamed protein product [Rotaria sp. Silwood2]
MSTTSFASYSDKLRQAAQYRNAANRYSQNSKKNVTLLVGQRAPDFTLYNTYHQQVSLHDLTAHSNVVLLFFPLAFTSVCTAELCSVRDSMRKYTRLNCTVLGISVDSIFALNIFKQEQQFSFDLLSDFNKEVARAYGALYEQFPLYGMKGVTKRAAFVIDRRGTIQYAEVFADPGQVPNFVAIEATLAKLENNQVSDDSDGSDLSSYLTSLLNRFLP